ncbi:MAG: J domain-containing protein [Candidatus Nitrosotalea sp.]|nr:J domain-containing protein [Candidatus Nitrosotalea sp.]
MNIEQCYELLGLQQGASIPEIKNAYRRMVLEHHPDKNTPTRDDVKFKLVTEAYQTIRTKNMDIDNSTCHKSGNKYNSYRELLTWTFYMHLPHDIVIYGQKIPHIKTVYHYFLQYKPVILTCGKLARKYASIITPRFIASSCAKIKSIVLHVIREGVVVDLLKYLGLHS